MIGVKSNGSALEATLGGLSNAYDRQRQVRDEARRHPPERAHHDDPPQSTRATSSLRIGAIRAGDSG